MTTIIYWFRNDLRLHDNPALTRACNAATQLLPVYVHEPDLDADPDDGAIKAATIGVMSSTYGFALLRLGDRLRPFMYGKLTQDELVDAVLSMKVSLLPGRVKKARRLKT